MIRILSFLLLLTIAGVGACTLLLPDRFTINAPLGQLFLGRGIEAPDEATIEQRMTPPPGFEVSLWAEGARGARVLRFTPAGDLLISAPRQNAILLAERDANGDGQSDGVRTLVSDLQNPHGIELDAGWLYIGETGALSRIAFDPGQSDLAQGPSGAAVRGELERVVTGIPAGGNHWTRTVRKGPDGWLYMNVGSSCNICWEEDTERRAALLRFNPNEDFKEETFATGLRNTVGFDWQPGTGRLYGVDNGRDLLGDDFPPCELNQIQRGGFYGFPVVNGHDTPDPDLGEGQEALIATALPPAHAFGAHTAPLGFHFIEGNNAPAEYQNAALVAQHGSWNRTEKAGYRVLSLHWQQDDSIEERDFLVGFEVDEDVTGRPADVIEGPDGAFYISDDYAGVIWRVAWTGET
ncbi:PQQ-dependent sugar dehydrogenase [Myxococcota bacterium]|nr:PQQ-dependent sugar dehydrogenase [Myxococcota bacterium]